MAEETKALKGKIQKFHLAKTDINVIEGFSRQSIISAVNLLKSEPMSLCLDCNTRWDGLAKKCEKCGAKYSKKPYESRIEYYICYEDVDTAFEDVTKVK